MPIVYNDVMHCFIKLNINLTPIPNAMEHAGKHLMFVKPVNPNIVLTTRIVYRVPFNGLPTISPFVFRGRIYELDVKLF